MKAVSYLRVSTREQGRSGLGIESQREAINRFAELDGTSIVKEFVEIESGKGSDALTRRPVLAEALDYAKKNKCEIFVYKIDRLGRNVHFISGLMEKKVPFVVTSLTRNIDNMQLHMYAAFSEREREFISQRTKDALKVLKANGTKLGTHKKSKSAIKKMTAKGHATHKHKAQLFAEYIYPTICRYRKDGFSCRKIAEEFNKLKIPTAREGGTWQATQVINIINRINKSNHDNKN